MTTEKDQATGQLDEATVFRVLGMVHKYVAEARAETCRLNGQGRWIEAVNAFEREGAGLELGDRLIAMYRASLGLEEA